jgi:uncharacterized protein YggU (UPF0235/DUF167 family)
VENRRRRAYAPGQAHAQGRTRRTEGIEPLADGTVVIKARVRAAPHDGAANDALRKLVGGALGVAPGRVSIVAGPTARIKTLHIEGDGARLAAALEMRANEATA